MKLSSTGFNDGAIIPGKFAFCIADPAHHVCLGSNLNPQLAWTGVPSAARSLAIVCHDPDVPSSGEDVNQEGRSVPTDLPRVDFFHWLLIDLPPSVGEIREGELSSEVTPRGKGGTIDFHGARQGVNDYTGWFAGDNDMRGDYYGYDGPCPPWNDERRHRYVFTVFALDVERLPLEGPFTGQQLRAAMAGHILDQATLTGIYTLNPKVVL